MVVNRSIASVSEKICVEGHGGRFRGFVRTMAAQVPRSTTKVATAVHLANNQKVNLGTPEQIVGNDRVVVGLQ